MNILKVLEVWKSWKSCWKSSSVGSPGSPWKSLWKSLEVQEPGSPHSSTSVVSAVYMYSMHQCCQKTWKTCVPMIRFNDTSESLTAEC
jgi:hypothetical protein